jgi:uncharacterized membrane protein
MRAMKRLGVALILFLSFCGLADSAYLTQHEVNGTPLLCNINGLSGCNIVASSPYSHIFGIPLSEYGLLFYGVLFVLTALELLLFDRILRRAIQGIAFFGLVMSAIFTLLQVFVINALCVYCMASAFLALLIAIAASFIEVARRDGSDQISSPPPVMPPHSFSMPPSA